MPMQITIPDKDPLMKHLERRALRRGIDRTKIRKRLPGLARDLISERISELEQHGDPLELKPAAAGSQ